MLESIFSRSNSNETLLSKYLKNGTMYLEEWFKCIEISIYLPHSINTGVEITYQHLVGGNMCDQLTY